MKEADLLKPIKENISKDFAGAKFERAFKEDKNGVESYIVIVKLNDSNWKLEYDKEGKFVKKTEAKKPMGKKATGTPTPEAK